MQINLYKKRKNEKTFADQKSMKTKITLLIPKGNTYHRLKRSVRALGLKCHPKDYLEVYPYQRFSKLIIDSLCSDILNALAPCKDEKIKGF